MKRSSRLFRFLTLLLVALFAALPVTAEETSATTMDSLAPETSATVAPVSTAAPFSLADLALNGVTPGASMDAVKTALGAPQNSGTETTSPATGSKLQNWTYDGLVVSFTDGLVSCVDTTSAAYTGPRGLRVGDTEETLRNVFYYDVAEKHRTVLYSAGWIESLSEPLPPCGTATKWDDGTMYYQYLAPVEPYSADVLASPETYLFQKHACLTLFVSKDTKTVTELSWFVDALSE